ncbi:MAG: hypothetical protein ACI8V2_000147 [Candidatus Latescibacterota bacterium]|jgi:hypothetical protein
MAKNDEFYIGYLDRPPAGIKKFVKKAVVGVFCIAAIVAMILVTGQLPFAASLFEFGNERTFEGIIQERPYPILLVDRPGQTGQADGLSRYPLVAFGKMGADGLVANLSGQRVKLDGTLIYRDNQTMIEVVDGTVQVIGSNTTDIPVGQSLGVQTLVGEIVDSKCFLGVMNPGNLKPHKACAIRCISGGIPPIFLVRDKANHASHYLLVSQDGQSVNQQVLDKIAEPLRIVGEVIVQGDLKILKADPKMFQRM